MFAFVLAFLIWLKQNRKSETLAMLKTNKQTKKKTKKKEKLKSMYVCMHAVKQNKIQI